jgi:hypothetical protein
MSEKYTVLSVYIPHYQMSNRLYVAYGKSLAERNSGKTNDYAE